MKKYELTEETKEVFGRRLHRIRALKSFGDVCEGDLGGWIESEKNLSQNGDAWVCGDAEVYCNAKVYCNAWICGGAWENSPCYIQGTRWPVNISSPDTVQCGCQNHTWQEWHDQYLKISLIYGAKDVLDEYIRYFNLLCEMYGHNDCRIIR